MIPSYNPQRDAITAALMRIQNPPPGNMMPQNDAFGSPALNAPPAQGSMGPIGGPYQAGLNLPGVTAPGQLPQSMSPQNALAMNPGMQQMPRGGLI